MNAEAVPLSLNTSSLSEMDPEIAAAIAAERNRQETHIELIASENFTYPAIIEAQGSVLTNKYAEGYPGKRYYGGCEHVDVVEELAIERSKELFGADHANVQPHSGSQANASVYLSALRPGDKILTMSLSDGGHLTHGKSSSSKTILHSGCAHFDHCDCSCPARLSRDESVRPRDSDEDRILRLRGGFFGHVDGCSACCL